jgi:hypothetical protein
LYLELKAQFEEITLPKAIVNTDQFLAECVAQVRTALRELKPDS